jgi:hypothetical protein
MRCGIYSIRLQIDSAMVFSQTMDRFSFDESRYINSLIDYNYYMYHRVRFNRMYIEPNNRLSVYDRQINRGVVSFTNSASHTALVTVHDFHGNSSRLNFSFEYAPGKITTPITSHLSEIATFLKMPKVVYQKEFTHSQPGIHIIIPAGALYDDINFTCSVSDAPEGLFSKAYTVHHPGTPLHKPATIEIAADSLPVRLREKALIVQIDSAGRRTSSGGAYRDGVVRGNSSVFGTFAIGVDTVPPRITPVNIRNGASMKDAKDIRFKIKDDFTGVNSYNGWIDGQWALFEYDAKNDLLFYRFDAGRLTRNTQHSLELKITDGKGNKAEYRAKFTW